MFVDSLVVGTIVYYINDLVHEGMTCAVYAKLCL